ncbi:autophagy associated protein Atg3 [Schizosaccharomyces japonicus yFS275]|uniref:Autophagy-related protein 3 n=1 Tax=Schizosaccharomyces japonicus (strain yFS275 / FY16936) TaxID=402676 RepID=B6JYA0_SCHJY|nr:autophagy associated protein Atg3 [Schizosaccharomyces japonicus yFS275]EEB06518.1 autophagy associated protein Atg3 [Schizosaccharomyces japonicus yFS275]
MTQRLASAFMNWRQHITPPVKDSNFEKTGMISPEQFVLAGDYLVRKFPTWKWETGDRIRDFLPKDRQYLVTKHVYSIPREVKVNVQEDWIDIETDHPDDASPETQTATDTVSGTGATTETTSASAIPDIDDFIVSDEVNDDNDEDDDDEEDDVQAAPVMQSKARLYDLYIAYDKYYRTPRLYLRGWDSSGQLLSMKSIYEDVSVEHAGKTVTMEPFPHFHSHNSMASVHPCKHASVLLKLMKQYANRGESFEVDHYMVLFLKFISTMLPYFEVDYTMQA